MKTKLLLLIGMLLINSCIPTGNIDKMPKNTLKGYVEFYYVHDNNVGNKTFYVYSNKITNGPFDHLEGRVSDLFSKRAFLRLARYPGEYSFKVDDANWPFEKLVTVSIENGMVVMVRIKFSNVVSNYPYTSYDESIYIEKTIPLSEYNSEYNSK